MLRQLFKKFTKHKKRIYLDYASITPIDNDVKQAIEKGYEFFYNPSSIHKDGVQARGMLDDARERVAHFFHAHADEIMFTASGTESCVTALRGVVHHAQREAGIETPHIIISAIEHAAVMETAEQLQAEGARVSIVPVDAGGRIDVAEVKELITKETVLISLIMMNNEIGVIEPIREMSLVVRKYKTEHKSMYPLFHTDASQALLYEDIDLRKIHVDLLTGDSIKCYGPRGVGVLVKRRDVMMDPLLTGGGQEKGLRSGTENVPGIVGFAKALEIARDQRESERTRLMHIRLYAKEKIQKIIPGAEFNEDEHFTSPHILNVCFKGSDAEYIVISLDALHISCSYASACQSLHGDTSSYVIGALQKSDCERSSVRFSFGRDTTYTHIDALGDALAELVHRKVIQT